MAKDTCLQCGNPLPANKELASVPNGRLVAFDPDANRVWRICAKCHHWNLLGPEASAAAMPELVARFATLPCAGSEGLAKAIVSKHLDLFRIGGAQERAARILALAKAKHELLSEVVQGVSIVIIAFAAWQLHGLYQAVQIWGLAGIAVGVLAMGTIGLLRPKADRHRNRYDRHLPIPLLLVGAAMTAGGLLAPRLAAASVLAPALLMALARLDGHRIVTLVWTPGRGDLRLREGSETIDMLGFPTFLDPESITIEQAVEAVERFERLGGLPAALHHVCEERGDPEGYLPFQDLSDEHRLLLAVAVRVAIVEPPHEVAAGLPDARMIAEVAESLDHPTGQA